eukprot:Awhi_evm1s10650
MSKSTPSTKFVQDGSKAIFFTKPFWSLGSQIQGRTPGQRYMNENAVRARAGLLNLTAWTVLMLLTNVEKPQFILYSIAPVVLWDMVSASIFGLTPFSPYGVVGTILTWKMQPIWKPATPKRFAWVLGACMVSLCIFAGSPLLKLKPLSLTVAGLCVALTWMEAVLGFCIGCYMWNTVVAPMFGMEVCEECKMEIPVGSAMQLDALEKELEGQEKAIVSKYLPSQPDVKVTVFSKDNCPFCIKAKALLKGEKINFNEINFSQMEDDGKAKLMTALKNYTGQTTVPNIFINDEHIGGSTDLQALHDSGKLQSMLNGDKISKYLKSSEQISLANSQVMVDVVIED